MGGLKRACVACCFTLDAWAAGTVSPESEADVEPFEEIGEDDDLRATARESGMRFGFDLIGAKAFGSLGRAVAPGMGGGMWLGYEAAIGPVALLPRLNIQYVRFLAGETRPVGVPVSTNASTITAFPGLGLTVNMPARPWLGVGFGYGRLRVGDEGGGLAGESRDTAFGVGVQGRIEFRVSAGMMLGLGGDYTLVFTRVENTRWSTFGLTATFFL